MKIETERFGTLECAEEDVLQFPEGMIGFPKENSFIIVSHSEVVAWLQSTKTPALAFPMVSAHAAAAGYPDVPIDGAARLAGLGTDVTQLAMLVVLSAQPGVPPTVNLMAPILVNVQTRRGAQVFLEGSRFGTREVWVRPKAQAEEGAESAGAPKLPDDGASSSLSAAAG